MFGAIDETADFLLPEFILILIRRLVKTEHSILANGLKKGIL
jgi:hypothetical protein